MYEDNDNKKKENQIPKWNQCIADASIILRVKTENQYAQQQHIFRR